ncbi:MAG TPA: type II toxin-antitoxin system VapC family toxin [archaeon]|nr:type II toxin-antitoxin system VapC family toxin [archaeon]
MALLDSTIIIDFLKNKPNAVKAIEQLLSHGEKLKTTVFNYYEIYFGELAFGKKQATPQVLAFLETLEIIFPSVASMQKSAEIRLELQKKGRTVGTNDLYIAGIAITANETLFTQNLKDFEQISGLKAQGY